MSPMSGPAGRRSRFISRRCWTDYDNNHVATYYNGYMGYACGVQQSGDVIVNFTAAALRDPSDRFLSRDLPGS